MGCQWLRRAVAFVAILLFSSIYEVGNAADPCSIELMPPSRQITGEALGEISFYVETDCDCPWTVESLTTWLEVLTPPEVVGGSTVRVRISELPTSSPGEVRVADKTFSVHVIPPSPIPCRPPTTTVYVSHEGGFGFTYFGVGPCFVEIGQPTVPWIRFRKQFVHSVEPAHYIADANPGNVRNGFVRVWGKRLNIFQEGPATGDSALCIAPGGIMCVARNQGGILDPMYERIAIGYRHAPDAGSQVLAADLNADGVLDVATLTEYGDLWRILRSTVPVETSFLPNELVGSPGFVVDAAAGSRAFAADANGDGFDDLVHLSATALTLLPNKRGELDGRPIPIGDGCTWSPRTGHEILAGNFDGRAGDELMAIDPGGAATLVPLDGADRRPFGSIGIGRSIPPEDRSCDGVQLLAGDFDGDGRCDVAAIAEFAILLARSDGSALGDPVALPTMGFHYAPWRGDGWHVFAADVTGDGRDDLVQLNQWGEFWTAASLGESFETPVLTGVAGYHHSEDGPWQVFFGRMKI